MEFTFTKEETNILLEALRCYDLELGYDDDDSYPIFLKLREKIRATLE